MIKERYTGTDHITYSKEIQHMNVVKKYWESVYPYLILYTPIACICAGIYYTISWVHGVYPDLSLGWVILFDSTHYIYLLIFLSFIYRKKKHGERILSMLTQIKYHVTISLAIQFNLIVHLFPSRYVWACVFVFLLPVSFFSDFTMMAVNSIIYIVSLTIGHLMHSEEFLPLNTPHYGLVLLYQVIVVLIAVIFQLTLTYFLEQFLQRTQIEEEENLFLMEKQLEYYKHLNIMDQELRRFRHDIKNHFLCIQTLLENSQKEEAIHYFYDLQKSFQNHHQVYLSGNVIVDSVLNYQLYQMKETRIVPVIFGKLPEIISITQMDLCTVFSNMLSNAVSAVCNCSSREPKLLIHFEHGETFFSITVTNTTDQTQVEEPHTKRPFPDRNHGHGLHQIKGITEKYQGIFEQNIENGLFTSRICLPI